MAIAISVRRMQTNVPASLYHALTGELGFSEREIVAHLSPLLGSVARNIGLALTLKLIESAGGGQIYLPQCVEKDTRLAQIVGVDAARKLIAELGGARHVVIPNPFGHRFWISRRAMQALKDGWSINQVVLHFGVSFNSARNWRSLIGPVA